MKTIPNASDMATKLIQDHPGLFKDDIQTKLVIVKAMHDYKDGCIEWMHQTFNNDSLFESFANIVRDGAIVNHGIDLSKIDD